MSTESLVLPNRSMKMLAIVTETRKKMKVGMVGLNRVSEKYGTPVMTKYPIVEAIAAMASLLNIVSTLLRSWVIR